MNGVEDVCPANCLPVFSFVKIPFTVSTACLRSSIGKST